MYSRELDTYPTGWERLIETGVTSTDMTLIYNVHGTPADAVASVERVQPDSVVFIEGFSVDETDDNDEDAFDLSCEPYLNMLNDLRIQHGKDHPEYRQVKEALLFSIDGVAAQYIAKDESDFTLHGLAKIKGLLEKDCLVLYADYKAFNATEDGDQQKAREYNQRFHALVNNADTNGLADAVGGSVGGALRSLISGVRAHILMHEEREMQAVLRSLSAMGRLAELPTDMAGLRRSEDGRLTAYTIFGTAHARSLTHQFTVRGMRPAVTIVEPVAEHLYLDVIAESGHENYQRRVGHTALTTLAYQLTHEFVAPSLVADAYNHLEFLNKATPEERLSFVVSCAHIQQLLVRGDRKTAEERYLALLRSFMPRSTAFKPPKSQTVYAMPSGYAGA